MANAGIKLRANGNCLAISGRERCRRRRVVQVHDRTIYESKLGRVGDCRSEGGDSTWRRSKGGNSGRRLNEKAVKS